MRSFISIYFSSLARSSSTSFLGALDTKPLLCSLPSARLISAITFSSSPSSLSRSLAESTKSPIGTSRVAQLTTFAAAFSPAASGEVTNFISDAPARRSIQSSLADISRFDPFNCFPFQWNPVSMNNHIQVHAAHYSYFHILSPK